MPIQVLVFGLGGIGAFFASRLGSLPGVRISAICRSNYDAVRDHGIRVISPIFGDNDLKLAYTFSTVNEAKQTMREKKLKWDYLIVSTKVNLASDPSHQLDGLVDNNTAIVLMQNGLGIEESYRKRFPDVPVLSSVTRVSMMQLSARDFKHCHWTRTSIGPYGSGKTDASDEAYKRNKDLAGMLVSAGISDVDVLTHTGMQFARWHKTAINAAVNPTSVLVGGSTNQAMSANAEVYEHQKGIMLEVLETAARVLDRPLPESLPTCEAVLDDAKRDISGSYSSMWHDWSAGREVELEAIVGNPLRQARAIGIEVPRLQATYALLKLLEQNRNTRG